MHPATWIEEALQRKLITRRAFEAWSSYTRQDSLEALHGVRSHHTFHQGLLPQIGPCDSTVCRYPPISESQTPNSHVNVDTLTSPFTSTDKWKKRSKKDNFTTPLDIRISNLNIRFSSREAGRQRRRLVAEDRHRMIAEDALSHRISIEYNKELEKRLTRAMYIHRRGWLKILTLRALKQIVDNSNNRMYAICVTRNIHAKRRAFTVLQESLSHSHRIASMACVASAWSQWLAVSRSNALEDVERINSFKRRIHNSISFRRWTYIVFTRPAHALKLRNHNVVSKLFVFWRRELRVMLQQENLVEAVKERLRQSITKS